MRIISKDSDIELRTITFEDLEELWTVAYKDNHEWMYFDGPYFGMTVYEKDEFINSIGPQKYVNKDLRFAIVKDNKIIGVVSAYYEDGNLRKWLELGIDIFDKNYWGKGIGYLSLKIFISYLFNAIPDIRRIGYTTWSGNYRMMKLGEKLGFKKEGQIRQVRYWQNQYWDSLKYGVLKEEWNPAQYYTE